MRERMDGFTSPDLKVNIEEYRRLYPILHRIDELKKQSKPPELPPNLSSVSGFILLTMQSGNLIFGMIRNIKVSTEIVELEAKSHVLEERIRENNIVARHSDYFSGEVDGSLNILNYTN